MTNPGMIHNESSPGLGLAGGTYAKRYRVWPPPGFKQPTRDELIDALRHRKYQYLRKIETDRIIRWLEVLDWYGGTFMYRRDPLREVTRTAGKPLESEVIDFLHVLRRELHRRPDRRPYVSVRIIRCGMCSHASERLWEATGETHTIVDHNDEPISAVMLCARCWSDYRITED